MGNSVDFGERVNDVRVGRWLSIDPLSYKQPAWSPYVSIADNPISTLDIDGLIPYPITIRAYAPFATFGFGFHGDNRGYSNTPSYANGQGPTARVHQRILFDTDKKDIETYAWSSPSFRGSNSSNKKTATPEVKFDKSLSITKANDDKVFTFGTHLEAGNPLTPKALTPNIDVFSDFSITEDKKTQTLTVNGKLTGDNFPSTEAFISDPSGQNVFLGVGQIAAGVGKNTGPFTELPGENKDRPITSFSLTITTDKQGNFTGVKSGDKTYTIADWNKLFTATPPQKQDTK